jgi:peptidoglycan hydrolase CwlO-like protein
MRYIVIVLMLLYISCTERSILESTNIINDNNIDSMIEESKEHLVDANKKIEESDSLVTDKIEKTAKKIDDLELEVKQLKKENYELKSKLDILDDDGQPFTLRTISDD